MNGLEIRIDQLKIKIYTNLTAAIFNILTLDK